MHNTIQDLKGSIRVYCRVRPIKVASAGDAEGGEESALGFFEDVERKDTAVALSYVRCVRRALVCQVSAEAARRPRRATARAASRYTSSRYSSFLEGS